LRQHTLVQPDARHRYADCKIPVYHSSASDSRQPRCKETHSGDSRHITDARFPVCDSPYRNHRHRRRADLFPSPISRGNRRAFPNAEWKGVLVMSTATVPPKEHKPEVKVVATEATQLISKGVRARPLFDPEILRRAIRESFVKLNPRIVAKNPVMFVVEVGAALTTLFVIKDAFAGAG